MERATSGAQVRVFIRDESDVVVARRRARELASQQRFSEAEVLAQALDLARRCNPPFDEDEVRRKVKRIFHPEPMTRDIRARLESQRAVRPERCCRR